MDYTRLARDEIEHELLIRGVKGVTNVTEMKSKLAELLKQEKDKAISLIKDVTVNEEEELETLQSKLKELRTAVVAYNGSSKSDSEYRRVETRLAHVLRRLGRIESEVETFTNRRAKLIEEVKAITDLLEEKVTPKNIDETTRLLKELLARFSSDERPTTGPRLKRVPIREWGVHFQGDGTGLSVSAFLERIEESRQSRYATQGEVLQEAIDLFRSSALIWYRSIRGEINSWEELANRLKAEFQPVDYDDDLLEEIRKRTQGPDESIGIYVAYMKNYMARLQVPLSQEEQLKIIRKNLDPYYIERLSLHVIPTIAELIVLGKKLENGRQRAERYQPPRNQRDSMEPDLAYQGKSRNRFEARLHPVNVVTNSDKKDDTRSAASTSRAKSDVLSNVCWNCGRKGHSFTKCSEPRKHTFCFGCGASGVIRRQCPSCKRPGNEKGGL